MEKMGAARSAAEGVAVDWGAIAGEPRFLALQRKKLRFLGLLMCLAIAFYFALPAGAAYFPGFFGIRVYGVVNVGIVLALAEFVIAWGIAALYTRRANREFDRLAEEINRDIMSRYLRARLS